MTETVHLHIGEPKTGTTHLQAMLFHHQERLREAGVLVPGRNLDHIRAGHDLLGRSKTAGTHSTEGAWLALVDEMTASPLPHSVFSMEMVTRARPRQASRAVDGFGKRAQVRVVITSRELSRLVPARWQESVQFRKSWSLDEYAAGVFANGRAREDGPAKHFWGLHDTPLTIRTWAESVGVENISIVTVPPSGSSPDLLWVRFGEALGVDLSGYSAAETSNASLGAASAEMMRRLNHVLADSDMADADHARICRKFLGKTVLPELKANEPTISLPSTFRDVARKMSEDIVGELRASGARIVGDLDDLLPVGDASDPLPPTDAQLADAAVVALAALVEQNAELARGARRRGRDLPFTEVNQ